MNNGLSSLVPVMAISAIAVIIIAAIIGLSFGHPSELEVSILAQSIALMGPTIVGLAALLQAQRAASSSDQNTKKLEQTNVHLETLANGGLKQSVKSALLESGVVTSGTTTLTNSDPGAVSGKD